MNSLNIQIYLRAALQHFLRWFDSRAFFDTNHALKVSSHLHLGTKKERKLPLTANELLIVSRRLSKLRCINDFLNEKILSILEKKRSLWISYHLSALIWSDVSSDCSMLEISLTAAEKNHGLWNWHNLNWVYLDTAAYHNEPAHDRHNTEAILFVVGDLRSVYLTAKKTSLSRQWRKFVVTVLLVFLCSCIRLCEIQSNILFDRPYLFRVVHFSCCFECWFGSYSLWMTTFLDSFNSKNAVLIVQKYITRKCYSLKIGMFVWYVYIYSNVVSITKAYIPSSNCSSLTRLKLVVGQYR